MTPINNKNQENVFLSQLNLPSQEKNDIDNNEKIIPFYPTPKIIEKNILVPNFKRMSERFNYNMNNQGFKSNADIILIIMLSLVMWLISNLLMKKKRKNKFILKK